MKYKIQSFYEFIEIQKRILKLFENSKAILTLKTKTVITPNGKSELLAGITSCLFCRKKCHEIKLTSISNVWCNWLVSFAPEFQCWYFCESSCLFYLSFNFDFYVSKIKHL